MENLENTEAENIKVKLFIILLTRWLSYAFWCHLFLTLNINRKMFCLLLFIKSKYL